MTRTVWASGRFDAQDVKEVRFARGGRGLIHDRAISERDISRSEGLAIVPADIVPQGEDDFRFRKELLGLRNRCARLELGFCRQETFEFLEEGIRITGDRDFERAGRFDPFSEDREVPDAARKLSSVSFALSCKSTRTICRGRIVDASKGKRSFARHPCLAHRVR